MASKIAIDIKEDVEYLRQELKSSRDFQFQKRIKCLILLKEGRLGKRTALSDHLCIGYSTLKRWLSAYRSGGLDALLQKGASSGRKSVVSNEVHAALEAKVHDCKDAFGSYHEAQRWVAKEFGEDIHYQTLRGYMKRHWGTKLKFPRKSHYKKDEQAVEAFKKIAIPDRRI